MTKVAIVVQRYGLDIVGGAESHARQLAERLVRDLHWQVDVLTTTAKDYRTWSNEYPPGTQSLNGVTVRRFASRFGRSPFFSGFNRILKGCLPALRRYRSLHPFVLMLEKVWFILQGPFCPELAQYIAAHAGHYDRFFFFTYLYYPTLWGHREVAHKATLIPTAHDEFPFHFETVSSMLTRVPEIFTNTLPEAALIKSKLAPDFEEQKIKVVGIGIDTAFFQPDQTRQKNGVTYLGRISHGKNVAPMLEWCRKHFSTTLIRLAGKVEADFSLPKTKMIEHLGFVSEEQKVELLQSSQCVINPSDLESLSLIVLEAIACGVPVLVNARCDVLAHYTKVCPTVFGYLDEKEFVDTLQKILNTDWTTRENQDALERSRYWLETHYSWQAVLKNFQKSIPLPSPAEA